jgi:hypothetical protein
MVEQKPIVVIGCAVLGVDMKHAARQLGLTVDFKFLEAGLHERPDLLKKKLQAAIDEVSAAGNAERIVIGYGVCGRGTIGIQSRNIPLVIPKVHDCIAMFMGGSEAYRREFKKFPGTYYISAGWHEEKAVPVSQRKLQAWYGDQRVHRDDIARQLRRTGGGPDHRVSQLVAKKLSAGRLYRYRRSSRIEIRKPRP